MARIPPSAGDDRETFVHFAASAPARAILIAGRPIHEEIAFGGAFVMNTAEELTAAQADLRAGRFAI